MPISSLVPVSDVSVLWFPSDGMGPNYEMVNDFASPDADWNEGNFAGDEDYFETENLPGAATSINSVRLRARLRRYPETPTGTWTFRFLCDVGGSVYSSDTSVSVGGFALYYTAAFPCPDGGGWTVSKVNSAKIGYRLIAVPPGKQIHASLLYLEVDYSAGVPLSTVESGKVCLDRIATSPVRVARKPGAVVEVDRVGAARVRLAKR